MVESNSIVYVVGSGINQVIKLHLYNDIAPPMINNFFQVAIQLEDRKKRYVDYEFQIVYNYVEKYWKKDRSALSLTQFDVEECFSFIELQLNEARQSKDFDNVEKLRKIQSNFKLYLAETLSEFNYSVVTSDVMRQLGLLLHKEKPIIITFNYDTYLEEILELSAGLNPTAKPVEEAANRRHDEYIKKTFESRTKAKLPQPSEDEVGYSFHNWVRSLGYGMEFNMVARDYPGVEELIEGKRFYSHTNNKPYPWYLLKLHGSLNWFRYLPEHPPLYGCELEPSLTSEQAEQIILSRQPLWYGQNPTLNGWYIDPLIITPTVYKERQLAEGVFKKISILWNKARDALSKCKRLVVIGYSFPPTDFMTKKLFLESFSDNRLNELVVVNPDTSVVHKIKGLCHYDKPVVVCKDLSEYLPLFDNDNRTK